MERVERGQADNAQATELTVQQTELAKSTRIRLRHLVVGVVLGIGLVRAALGCGGDEQITTNTTGYTPYAPTASEPAATPTEALATATPTPESTIAPPNSPTATPDNAGTPVIPVTPPAVLTPPVESGSSTSTPEATETAIPDLVFPDLESLPPGAETMTSEQAVKSLIERAGSNNPLINEDQSIKIWLNLAHIPEILPEDRIVLRIGIREPVTDEKFSSIKSQATTFLEKQRVDLGITNVEWGKFKTVEFRGELLDLFERVEVTGPVSAKTPVSIGTP